MSNLHISMGTGYSSHQTQRRVRKKIVKATLRKIGIFVLDPEAAQANLTGDANWSRLWERIYRDRCNQAGGPRILDSTDESAQPWLVAMGQRGTTTTLSSGNGQWSTVQHLPSNFSTTIYPTISHGYLHQISSQRLTHYHTCPSTHFDSTHSTSHIWESRCQLRLVSRITY